jgi:type II secretory pathway pseudopilin PulG
MKPNGFSLIEACIALIVIGLVMAPLIAEYNDHMRKVESDITAANTFAVKSALEAYYIKNDRYPCPASLNKKMGEDGYGDEATTSATSCIPSALTVGNCWQGVCLYEDLTTPLLPVGNRLVVHGGVPFAALQMNRPVAKVA